MQGSGCGVQGSGFRVQGSGCRVQGVGFRVQGSEFIQGLEFKIQGSEFRVQGSGFRVRDSGFRVQGSRTPIFSAPKVFDLIDWNTMWLEHGLGDCTAGTQWSRLFESLPLPSCGLLKSLPLSHTTYLASFVCHGMSAFALRDGIETCRCLSSAWILISVQRTNAWLTRGMGSGEKASRRAGEVPTS